MEVSRSVTFNIYGSINTCFHKAQDLMNCGNGGNTFYLVDYGESLKEKKLIQNIKRMHQHGDKTKPKPLSLANEFMAISFMNDS